MSGIHLDTKWSIFVTPQLVFLLKVARRVAQVSGLLSAFFLNDLLHDGQPRLLRSL